jgi:putative spermidine/putrescine transport system ATP-binding protein
VPVERPAAVGERLAFAVRRDRMRVQPAQERPAQPMNAVTGSVAELEYQGTYMKVTIALDEAGAPACVAFVEERAFFQLPVAVGQRVACHWAADEAHGLAA